MVFFGLLLERPAFVALHKKRSDTRGDRLQKPDVILMTEVQGSRSRGENAAEALPRTKREDNQALETEHPDTAGEVPPTFPGCNENLHRP